jgi:Ser/Thr protein kinase RdoA (MazF antagonist)
VSPEHDILAAWCTEAFGVAPVAKLFETGHLSRVTGYRLPDGVTIVVKTRPAAERVLACLDLQDYLHRRGFPCPQPLAGPTLHNGLLITAETFIEPGEKLTGTDAAPKFAAALWRLLSLTQGVAPRLPLEPPPPWLGGWQHDGPVLWPPADDLPDDLNAIDTPWLDGLARRAATLLRATPLPRVIGHADWTAGNLEWRDGELHAVHDWDSLAYLPEAVFSGGASVLYCSTTTAIATVAQSEAFLSAYEASRGSPFTPAELAVAWAAGLWNLAFDAKKDLVRGGGESLDLMRSEGGERLRRVSA